MTITQEQIAGMVKRLLYMGFHGTENVLHRTRRWSVERKEAADMLEQLAADILTVCQREAAMLARYDAKLDALDRANHKGVKLLEWQKYGENCWAAAAPLFGSLRVEHYGNDKWQALWSVPGYCDTFVEGDFSTADDAKAAIESRVLTALEPASDARSYADGVEDAAKVAEKMQQDVDDTNDAFAAQKLPGVCVDPDGHDIAAAIRALLTEKDDG